MRVKTLWSMDNNRLDRKVNEFLAQPGIRVVDLLFDATLFSYSVMIMYEEAHGREQA